METYFGIEIECLLTENDKTTMSRISRYNNSEKKYDNIMDILNLYRKDDKFVAMIKNMIVEYGTKWYYIYENKNIIDINAFNKNSHLIIHRFISSLYIIYKLDRIGIRFIPPIYPQEIKEYACLYPVIHENTFKFTQCNSDERWDYTIDGSVTDNSELYKRVYRDDGGKIRYYSHKPVLQYNEIVTDIVNLRDIQKFREELKTLYNNRSLQFYFNDSTSMHVHLSKWRRDKNIYREDPRILYNTMRGWLHFEFIFYSLVASWRFGNIYCYPINMSRFGLSNSRYRGNVPLTQIYSREFILNLYTMDYDSFIRELNKKDEELEFIIDRFSDTFIEYRYNYKLGKISYHTDNKGNIYKIPAPYILSSNSKKLNKGKDKYLYPRYRAVNLTNLLPNGYGTIEFRLRHGSTDAEECAQFIRLCSRFLDYFINVGDKIEYDINPIIDYNLRTFAKCKFPKDRIFSEEKVYEFDRFNFKLDKDNREVFELMFREVIRDPALYRYYKKKNDLKFKINR